MSALERAQRALQTALDVGDRQASDPLSFEVAGLSAGGMQRQFLLLAAVEALVDIAISLRVLTERDQVT